MAAALAYAGRVALLPIRVHGTALPPNLLLMAKLIVLGLVLKQYPDRLPDAFAPILPFFDVMPAPYFRWAMKLVFALAATALLFNQAVRTSCLILGSLFLVATLVSRVYYHNSVVFVALVFLMIGLQERNRPPTLLSWQLGIMYLGAGLNKLLEADWRSGQYFAYFLSEIYGSEIYAPMAALLPSGWLALYLCWHVIAAELLAGTLFFVSRLRRVAVWVSAGVHGGAAMLVMDDYGIFLSAVLASYLLIVNWPAHLLVRFRPRSVASVLARLHWLSHATDPSVRYATAADTTVQIESPSGRWTGAAAVWRLALRTPVLYMLLMAFVAGARRPIRQPMIRGVGIVTALLLVTAAVIWLRKRWRLSAGSRTVAASRPDAVASE